MREKQHILSRSLSLRKWCELNNNYVPQLKDMPTFLSPWFVCLFGWFCWLGNVMFEHHATENISHNSPEVTFQIFCPGHTAVNPDQPSALLIQPTNQPTTYSCHNTITSGGLVCIKQCMCKLTLCLCILCKL